MLEPNIINHLHTLINSIDGTVGISISDLENTWKIAINADDHFPMASTCKVAIAAYCLHLVEQGKLDKDSLVPIYPTDIRPGSGIIHPYFTSPGVILSIENLIRLMIEVSDNTATDLLLKMIGGPIAVTRFLQAHAIHAMRLDRNIFQLISQQMGIAHLIKDGACTLEEFILLEQSINPEKQERSKSNFLLDERDTTTPNAAHDLLEKILRNEIVNSASSQFILHCMGQCRNGVNRIRAGIPASIWVGQKTGSMYGITNDIAVIQLPEKNMTLIMAIYIKQSRLPLQDQENIIASIARNVYESLPT